MRALVGVVLAFASGAALAAELRPPQFQQVFGPNTDVQLHALAIPEPDGSPHLLVSSGAADDRGGGPRKLQIVRSRMPGEAETIDLISVQRLGPLLALAATPAYYAVAYQTVEGLHVDLYFPDGRPKARLDPPVPEHAPVGVWAMPRGIVVVSNHGLFLLDADDGTIVVRERGPETGFTASAAFVPAEECGLASVFVDTEAKTWTLQRRCIDRTGFRLAGSETGPGDTDRSYQFSLRSDPADPRRFHVGTAEAANVWAVHECSVSNETSCGTVRLQGVPFHAGVLFGGLHLFSLDGSTLGAISGTEDMRDLWSGRFSQRGGEPQWSRRWAAPVIKAKGFSLMERVFIAPTVKRTWLAYSYWAFDGDWTPGNLPTERRIVVAVTRMSFKDLFGTRQ